MNWPETPAVAVAGRGATAHGTNGNLLGPPGGIDRWFPLRGDRRDEASERVSQCHLDGLHLRAGERQPGDSVVTQGGQFGVDVDGPPYDRWQAAHPLGDRQLGVCGGDQGDVAQHLLTSGVRHGDGRKRLGSRQRPVPENRRVRLLGPFEHVEQRFELRRRGSRHERAWRSAVRNAQTFGIDEPEPETGDPEPQLGVLRTVQPFVEPAHRPQRRGTKQRATEDERSAGAQRPQRNHGGDAGFGGA